MAGQTQPPWVKEKPMAPKASQPRPASDTLLELSPDEAFLSWLDAHRKEIADEWVKRLSSLSARYANRPLSELRYTVRGAFGAYREALATGKVHRIGQFIDYITRKRLKAGFLLSDVQQAFELFRIIVLDFLLEPPHRHLLARAIRPLNACLSHTIHGFSDHFQHTHDLLVNSHARELEEQVRQRTAELADERRRYKTLVEEITDGFFVIENYNIQFANAAFCRMHGVEWAQAEGRPFLSFVSPAERPLVRAAYRDALAGRKSPQPLVYKRLGCSPDRADTEIKSRVVDLGQGRVIIGICRDISERLAMEAKVREHERLAYVGQLTASLSHEIRNPLSAIKLNMQILSRKLDLDGFDRRRLDITAREVTRLEEIMRQLLDTARPSSLEQTPVDLAELVRGAVDLLETRLVEGGVKLRQSHAHNLPRTLADPSGLQQAVQNLLLNAMEAAGRGGSVRVWTKLAAPRRERCLEVGVADDGPGIAAEDLPRLFTPFFTNRHLGTGLGLFNVKRIAEAHGGSVVVKSRPGQGASFVLRLPCLP